MFISTSYGTAAVFTGLLGLYAYLASNSRKRPVSAMLPHTLSEWRLPGADEQIWKGLSRVFQAAGFMFWLHQGYSVLTAPNSHPSITGFGYFAPHRGAKAVGGPSDLWVFQCNPLCRAARTRDGLDVIVRVIVHRGAGQDHLKILRRIATGENSQCSTNHALPMFQELQLEDIIFGIFPKVGARVSDVYGAWAKNSVGDVIEVIMQMLEGLAFIHENNIAHRDAFHDNFLIQWHPESLKEVSPTRPRVYITDFEVAVEFPPECPADKQISIGVPIGGSFSPEQYSRPLAPELRSGEPYSPFKLDVWQLGSAFSPPYFKTTISSFDEVLAHLTDPDPDRRLGAQEALDRLRILTLSTIPRSLLIEPFVTIF